MRRLALLCLLILVGCGGTVSSPTTPSQALDLVMVREGDLWRFNTATQAWKQLTSVAPAAIATQPSASPDGATIVYTYRPPQPTPSAEQPFIVPVTSIATVAATGGAEQSFSVPSIKYDSLDQPVWSPDGATVYATYHTLRFADDGTFLAAGDDIVAIDAATHEQRTVLPNATWPALSPDGMLLAAIRLIGDLDQPQLIVYDLLTQQTQVVLSTPDLVALEAPVWSADSRSLYVAVSPLLSGEADRSWLADMLAPQTVEAHGTSWRVWAVERDNGTTRELSTINFEDPRIVVDGTWLYVWSLNGLWRIDSTKTPDQNPQHLLEPGDVGGLTRLP